MMKRDIVLRLVFSLSIIVLLGDALMINRDYQDSWVLEGLEIPFLFFVVTFALTFFSEEKVSWLVFVAVVGRIVFLMIPNLKYTWFQGVAVDQQLQYNLASHVVATGSISTQAITPSFPFYIDSPLLHVLLAMFSLVTNASINDAMKYVPVLFSPLYPLLTYAIVKKLELAKKSSILKYALFVSAIPTSIGQINVGGNIFGIVLAFIALYLLVSLVQKNDKRYLLACIIFIVALAAAHSVSSVILATIVFSILVVQRVRFFRPESHLRGSVALVVVSIALIWLMFPANYTMEEISKDLLASVVGGSNPRAETMPPTFVQLAHADALAAAKTLLVYYGADLSLVALTFVGLIILLRMRKKLNSVESFLMLFCGLTFAVMLLGVVINLGARRVLTFERILAPVFVGAAVSFAVNNKRWTCKWILPLVFGSILFLSTIQLYCYQPMVPSANILHKEMPSSVPIGYLGDVNSIYQRQIVNFALAHVAVGRISADAVTHNQIAGVADFDFMVANVGNYYYPLDPQHSAHSYDLLIIHVPGKAGIYIEQANARSPDLILQTIYGSSIIYTNGESYMLHSSSSP